MKRGTLILACVFFTHFYCVAQKIDFTKKQSLPKAGYGMLTETDGKDIYVTGGEIAGGTIWNREQRDYLFAYNAILDSWVDLSDSFNRFKSGGISSIVYLNEYRTLLIGGNTILKDSIKFITIPYDIDTYETTNIFLHPYNNFFQSAVYYKGLVYFFGGHQSYKNTAKFDSSSSRFYSFDPSNLSFNSLDDMPLEASSKGVIAEQQLYIIGGVTMLKNQLGASYRTSWSDKIYVYNFLNKEWNQFITLEKAPQNYSVANYLHYLFIIGGKEEADQLTVIDTKTNMLVKLSMNVESIESSAIVLNDNLHLIGGLTKDGHLTNTHYTALCEDIVLLFEEIVKDK